MNINPVPGSLSMAKQDTHHHWADRRQRGLSLVEVMVSLAIGLVVVGAVFANYLNNSVGSRQAAALAQVTQDGALALGILRNHIAMAGYSRPASVSSGAMTRVVGNLKAITGCNEGFDPSTDNNADYDTITCNAASSTTATPKPDSIAISYEADTSTSPTVNSTAPVPSDCAGQGLVQDVSNPTNAFYVADNRFSIIPAQAATTTQSESPPALGCLGNGNVTWGSSLKSGAANKGYLPLVENIQFMSILYGVSKSSGTQFQYLKASDIRAGSAAWSDVTSVRICVVVQSEKEVLDKPRPYYDCDGNTPTPSDRRIYRAFKTTVLLNNRATSS